MAIPVLNYRRPLGSIPPLEISASSATFRPMSSEAEAQLVARCRRGEAQAWDDLFNEHYAAAARFIFQLSQSFTREDAEEICQETFLAVINHLKTFHGASRMQTWIFRIASNKARDYLQRQQAAKRGGGETILSLNAENPENRPALDPPSSAPSPDAAILTAESAAQVAQALQHLGDPCRGIIELRYYGDLSYEEIAAELKMNPKTVSSRLSKCLDRLEKIALRLFSGKSSTPSSV